MAVCLDNKTGPVAGPVHTIKRATLAKRGAFFCAFFLVVGCEGSVSALEVERENKVSVCPG